MPAPRREIISPKIPALPEGPIMSKWDRDADSTAPTPVANICSDCQWLHSEVLDNCYDLIQEASDCCHSATWNSIKRKCHRNIQCRWESEQAKATFACSSWTLHIAHRRHCSGGAQGSSCSFFVAYSLALPEFWFRANAREASMDEIISDLRLLGRNNIDLRLLMTIPEP